MSVSVCLDVCVMCDILFSAKTQLEDANPKDGTCHCNRDLWQVFAPYSHCNRDL